MPSDSDRKAALKQLRQQRRPSIKNATAAIKAQRKSIDAIQKALAMGAATIPEVAAHTRIPADEVLWFVATMKKYGQIVEDGKDGGYYRYAVPQAVREEEKTGEHP